MISYDKAVMSTHSGQFSTSFCFHGPLVENAFHYVIEAQYSLFRLPINVDHIWSINTPGKGHNSHMINVEVAQFAFSGDQHIPPEVLHTALKRPHSLHMSG